MTRHALLGLILLGSVCAARPAAATSCGFNSVTPVAFGTYDVFSATPDDAVGQFIFQCSVVFALDSIKINLSTGSSGTYSARTLQNGVNTLSYNLYLDAARSSVWGDTNNGTAQYTSGLNLFAITVPIYGRIPARQNAKAGNYTDTVVITMLF